MTASAATSASIPLVDLVAQIESIRGEVDEAIARVVGQAAFVLSPPLEKFEAAFAKYVGVKHCVGVQSGTAALHLALLAIGIGPGDEVVTVPSSFFATAEAISLAGARPVFVDAEEGTLHLDPSKLAAALSPRTKAVIPVHLYGQPADLRPIRAIADARGIAVIEDACQAHGATCDGRRAGALGRAGAFSFYPGKNLGAFGEGGAITTDDDALAARLLRNHGSPEKYKHTIVGFNYRLDGLQAAVLDVKLRHLDRWNERRRQLAARYRERLAGPGFGDLRLLAEPTCGEGVYHLFIVRSAERERIFSAFAERGIARAIHYPIPIHLQEAYRDLGHAPGSFPVAEAAAREVLSLPLYPELTEAQQDRVVDALAAAFR